MREEEFDWSLSKILLVLDNFFYQENYDDSCHCHGSQICQQRHPAVKNTRWFEKAIRSSEPDNGLWPQWLAIFIAEFLIVG